MRLLRPPGGATDQPGKNDEQQLWPSLAVRSALWSTLIIGQLAYAMDIYPEPQFILSFTSVISEPFAELCHLIRSSPISQYCTTVIATAQPCMIKLITASNRTENAKELVIGQRVKTKQTKIPEFEAEHL
jgi:hypothetical protein